jgi:hypothetical protein
MIVELRFDDRRPRSWMRHLMALLETEPYDLQVAWVATDAARPAGLEALLDLERMMLRRGRFCGADRDPALRQADAQPLRQPDIVLDFTAMPRDADCPARLYLRPLYDGEPGEDAALAAIVAGDLPLIEIRDEVGGATMWSGQPSGETAEGLGGALGATMARTATLLRGVLTNRQRQAATAASATKPARSRSPAGFVVGGLAKSIAKRIYRLCCYSPHWRIGWRYTDDAGIWQSGDLSGAAWHALPSPANRFYADPFPVTWKGRTFVFFEDLDHRIGKGTISAIEFGEAGPIGAAVPVLEEPWHLSYPFLIVHDDELWMIPETSHEREVTIYKCVGFPLRWERHATLLSGVELADATILHHDGLNYLFGATRDGDGGYSDTLSIYYADDLFGPWTPHAQQPVLVDRASARPAGHFVRRNGRLWRPVQDCTRGYGCALGLAEITELSPETFAQTVHFTVGPGPRWPGRKLHTLNRCGRLELIDGTVIQPKLESLRLVARAGDPATIGAR